MKILILDDDQTRHDAFQRIYAEHEVVSVLRYRDFLSALNEKWDLIHLDHDLGDHETAYDTYVDGWGKTREYNGRHASMKVCELPEESRPLAVIVHSINSVGALEMISNLKRAGIDCKWEPFGEIAHFQVQEILPPESDPDGLKAEVSRLEEELKTLRKQLGEG